MVVNCVDGSLFNVPDTFVDSIGSKSYVVFRNKAVYNYRYYYIFVFDRKVNMSNDGTNMFFKVDDLNSFTFYYWDSVFDSYLQYDFAIDSVKISCKQFDFFGCSEDLLSYVDGFSKDGFEFDWADYSSVMVSSLRDVDMSSGAVFGEMFGVLPVLLVVLVSFIGIRKGISYLFSLLKKT